jgi:N-acetylmuramoyl-L-alanine amidase
MRPTPAILGAFLALAMPAPLLAQSTGSPQSPAPKAQPLFVAYPSDNHETTSDRIFLIGTAAAPGTVTVNGKTIARNSSGHFAPTFPLQMGANTFTLQYGAQRLTLTVKRNSTAPRMPQGLGFAEDSLSPSVNIARLPGETICFGAIAPANAQVSVSLGESTLALYPQTAIDLPPNNAVLTGLNQPTNATPRTVQRYEGCGTLPGEIPGTLLYGQTGSTGKVIPPSSDLGIPVFSVTLNGQTVKQTGKGKVTLLSPLTAPVIEVTVDQGTARTGPSTDFSRLTPLPKGTRAQVTGREANWYRLDYGGWIRENEAKVVENAVPPRSQIRSVSSRAKDGWTEMAFPLQVPVPISISQDTHSLTLTLYNTTAQTDTIYTAQDPVLERLDWQQTRPGEVQYTLRLKGDRQWGYKTRYEGTTLILSLKHPPTGGLPKANPLKGLRIFIDPGHGSANDLGARGPTGYPEKDVVLVVSKLLRSELEQRGATVTLSREAEEDLYPQDRVALIQKAEPDLSLSLHYNALPDNGDALKVRGFSTYWYHPQAHALAQQIHDQVVKDLGRPSYGVFWNNLALTRPSWTPAVLLELGFMINPDEFDWIVNRKAQVALARSLADGIQAWSQGR